MNPGRYFIPNMGIGYNPMMTANYMMPRNMGLFSRITNGIRSVNWGGLLTNANKTLDVVNQAIPLVRKAGPMMNNMKSMLSIAKAFGNETVNKKNNFRVNSSKKGNSNLNSNIQTVNNKDISSTSEQPNFFI